MEQGYFGIEQITQEDRAYNGSRFSEVREAIFANPYQQVWGREGEPPMPHYEVTLGNMLRGILPFAKHYYLAQASKRTVDSHADLRWGPDKKGFRRIIHSNGVCLTGLWEITEKTAYSGYFSEGSGGLLVGRYSSGANEIHRGRLRPLAPVPKRKLTFHIEVTDEGTPRIGLGALRQTFKNWRRIGKLTFDNAVASYNGDFVIHFNHPG